MLSPATFLSYARKDSQSALKLASDLKAMGVDVWLDQLDISPGERWDRAVEAALSSSTRLIVILSPASMASENVMDEVSYAIEEKKDIVPVIFEDCERPLRMRRFQYIDFTADYAAALKKLLSLLKAMSHSSEKGSAKKAVTKGATRLTPKSSRSTQPRSDEMAVLDPTSSNSSVGSGKSLTYNGHRIKIQFGLFVEVLYDGEKIASDSTTHYVFDASEDGEEARYEIFIVDHFLTWKCEVRRNGRVIFSDA
jgi:hypothetical protein